MIIIVISECTKKALPKTRKILSHYFWQMGRRTWMGKISEEGLKDVEIELKKIVTRQSSIAIWRMIGRKKYELLHQLGNKKRFNEKGLYAWSTKKLKPFDQSLIEQEEINMNLNFSIATTLVSLAALFHDLGKGTVGFQKKLSQTNPKLMGDPVRHEVLSCWILNSVFNQISDSESNEERWLEIFSSTEKLKELFIKYPQLDLNTRSENLKNERIKTALSPWNDFIKILPIGKENGLPTLEKKYLSLKEIILWLVLSHHKLPEGNYLSVPNAPGIENLQKMYFRYENKSSPVDYKKELEGNYTKLAIGEQPWENTEWLNKVTTQAKKLFDLYKLMDYTNIQEFLPSVYLLLRPALILGDYNASARKVATAITPEKNIIYANTKIENNEKMYCDSLPTHLLKAEEDSQNFVKLYHHILNKEKTFPNVLFKGQKPNYELINSFTWQDDFAKKIENLRKDNDNTPFFCSLFAGTGSGKTLGIIKTMQAIAPQVGQARYSLGVGLKTLATQTAHEYWNKEGRIKLKKEDLLVFIGDRIARNEAERVLEEYKEAKEEKKEFNEEELGISNSVIDKERLEIFSEFDGGAENILDEIKNYTALSEKDKIILSTPITVATIDHYIPGSELLSGTDAGMSLRLATSDLAIDEIDSFSYSDIPALQRLIFFSGYFGRSVLLSSASMSFELNKSFFTAWEKGLTAGNLLRTKKITQFGYALASENYQNSCAHIQPFNSEINFNNILQCFLNEQIKYLNNQFPRRTLSANITPYENISKSDCINVKDKNSLKKSWFKSIQKQAISFHKTNANPIVVNEKEYNFSVGFTRFNQIPVAQNSALWLSENATIPENNFCFVVINYHSKYLRIDRSIIENYLDKNLKWIEKDNKYVAKLFSDETLLKFIAKNSQHRNICLVVSTTSIQETGRDHDYDWCILDPCSVKSLVQAAGRVRRHRKWEYTIHNIAILNVPSQVWFSEKEQKNINDPWSFPGFGDYKIFSQPLFLLLRQFPSEKAMPKYTGPMSKTNNTANPHKDLIDRTKSKLTHLGIQFPIESPEKGFTESESFLNTKEITKIDAQESYFFPNNLTDNPARCYAEIYEKWYADGFNENTWSGTNILSNYILNLFQHSHKMTEFRQSDINSTKKRTSIKLICAKNRVYYFIQPFEGKFWEIRNKERHEKNKALINISVDNIERLSNNTFVGNSKYFLLKLPLEAFNTDVLQKIKDIKDTKCKEEIRESYERLELNLNHDKEYALINGEYKTEAMYIREIGLYYPLKK